jgi:hypothetical protein
MGMKEWLSQNTRFSRIVGEERPFSLKPLVYSEQPPRSATPSLDTDQHSVPNAVEEANGVIRDYVMRASAKAELSGKQEDLREAIDTNLWYKAGRLARRDASMIEAEDEEEKRENNF